MKAIDSIQFSSIFRLLLMVVVFVAPQVVRAELWHADVGAESAHMGNQAMAFLPNEMWIHVGDSITWKLATNEPHTVTFLEPAQIRPPFPVGCPGATPDGSNYDTTACVNSDILVLGQAYTVTFPKAGNFKLTCLIHASMTGAVHVLDGSETLPHDQAFYDDQGARQGRKLLADAEGLIGRALSQRSRKSVIAGTGEVVGTGGGSQYLSVMRFLIAKISVHVGETVEWTNFDPVEPHTVTFGTEPGDVLPPSSNVTTDTDLALHATLGSPGDSVNSGFIGGAPQDRIGLEQSPLGTTQFRVTFTRPGTFNYICGLHDELGMRGQVIVAP